MKRRVAGRNQNRADDSQNTFGLKQGKKEGVEEFVSELFALADEAEKPDEVSHRDADFKVDPAIHYVDKNTDA